MACRQDNVILELPWLKAANLFINWKNCTLSLDQSIDQSAELYSSFAKDTDHHHNHYWKPPPKIPRHVNIDTITNSRLYQYNSWEEESQEITRTVDNWNIYQIIRCSSWFIPAGSPLISRLTIATELAMVAEKAKPKVTLLLQSHLLGLHFNRLSLFFSFLYLIWSFQTLNCEEILHKNSLISCPSPFHKTCVCLMANLILLKPNFILDSSFLCCAWLCCHTHAFASCSCFSSILLLPCSCIMLFISAMPALDSIGRFYARI